MREGHPSAATVPALEEADPSNTPLRRARRHPTSSRSPHAPPTVSSASARSHRPHPDAPPHDETPPPVPPKNSAYFRLVKSAGTTTATAAGIAGPTDISPARCVFSHSLSDSGHPYRPSTYLPPRSSEDAPALPMPFRSRHKPSSRPFFSFSPDAPNPRSARMEHVAHSPPRARLNRLHKPRPQPPASPQAPASPSVFARRRSRATSTEDPSLLQHPPARPPTEADMASISHRPVRSLSDGSNRAPSLRSSSGARSAGRTDSTYTTSSTASTSQSSTSTTLTTPDSTPSPDLSPRNSVASAKKLRKRRPPVAPSAYPFPPGAPAAALGRSKSTPNGLGQRSPKNRLWSSVSEARQPDGSGSHAARDPSMWPASVSRTLLLRAACRH